MTVRKTLSRLITLIVSLLLAASVAASYISILSDREASFICTLTASHSGKYQTVITYTDDQSWKGGDRTLKSEIDLEAGVPFTLDLRRVVPRSVQVKKVDISLNYLGNDGDDISVDLSNLEVNRKKVTGLYVKDQDIGKISAEKCSSGECSTQISDRFTLNLTGNTASTFSIVSDLNLKVYRTHYAVLALIIIVAVGTGIFYKLIRYVLHKRREQSVNVPDIVFIVAVVLTGFVPASLFDSDHAVDNNENRTLANYKPLFVDDGIHPINFNWTRDFETWFNDRFGGRSQLINLQKDPVLRLNSLISVPRAGVCQTENSWCFTTTEMSELSAAGYDGKFPNTDYISKIAAGTDIPVYLLVFPLKTEIYPDKVFFSNSKVDGRHSFSSQAIEHLKTVSGPNVHVVNLTPVFKEDRLRHPEALSYFIDEHHATEYGTKVVMDYLNATIPEFKDRVGNPDIDSKYPPGQFQVGSGEFADPNAPDEIGRSGWSKHKYGSTWGAVFGNEKRFRAYPRFPIQSYPFYSLTEGYMKDVTYEHDRKCDANIHLHNKNAPQFKVYILGNSFVETLSKTAATEVSDIYRRRINNNTCAPHSLTSDGVLKQLEELRPDVVLMTIYGETFEDNLK